jgi:large subunit ribosomal protein L5
MVPKLMESRGYQNLLEVPKLSKVVISTGVGTAKPRETFDEAVRVLSAITGQRPVIAKSRVSVAGFKLREGQNVGVFVTIRGQRMYDFLYRLINVGFPRVRDFRGISSKAFDGFGNYSVGLTDQTIFTEIDLDKMKHTIGMNITIVTTAKTNDEAFELLTLMGMPFKK